MNNSIFPFIDTSKYEDVIESDKLEELCEYAFDFKNNCLLANSAGQNYYVHRNEALKVWIYKALMTPRYQHLAYTEDYGNEMFSMISQAIDQEVMLLELKRYITEALMYNPYIQELNSFEFEVKGSEVLIRFTVISIYGQMQYEQIMKEGVGQ